jgi:hypothetical protein
MPSYKGTEYKAITHKLKTKDRMKNEKEKKSLPLITVKSESCE